MSPLQDWTEEDTIDHLVWKFYLLRDRLNRIFLGQEVLKHESLVYYFLGECQSIIQRLREFHHDTAQTDRELEKLLRDFSEFCQNKGRRFSGRVIPDLTEIISDYVHWISIFKNNLVEGESVPDHWDALEFETMLSDRESFEYALMGMHIARQDYPVKDLQRLVEESEPTIREIIPTLNKQYSDTGYIVQRPDRYPPSFWWRKMAWESIQNHPQQ